MSERGTADDLTSDRGNTESDCACCTYCTAKARSSCSSRELKGIGEDWPRLTTEYDDAWVAAGRRQRRMGMKSRYSSASALHSPLRTVELFGLLVLLWRLRRLNTLWVETSGAEISGERMKSSSGRYSGLLRVVNWLWPGLLHRACRGCLSVLHGTSATVVFPACVGTSEARLESVAESVALQ